MGDYGGVNNSNREASFPSASRPPPSGLMSPIAEMGNKNVVPNSSENAGFGENRHNNYSSGFPVTSWEDSMMISDNMPGVKRLREDDRSLSGLDLDGAETQVVLIYRNASFLTSYSHLIGHFFVVTTLTEHRCRKPSTTNFGSSLEFTEEFSRNVCH